MGTVAGVNFKRLMREGLAAVSRLKHSEAVARQRTPEARVPSDVSIINSLLLLPGESERVAITDINRYRVTQY